MLAIAVPFSPLTSPPSPPLSTSPTLWRCSSSPSCFHFSSTTSTTPLPQAPLPLPPPPAVHPLPTRSPSPRLHTPHHLPPYSLDTPASPTASPAHSLTPPLSSAPSLSTTASPAPTGFSSARVSRYLRHLPPMAQHHFYHWLHIRSLYESQFAHYVAGGSLMPLDVDTYTESTSQPLTFDSYRVHLTTVTTTVMPHATATTSTSTSYRQLTSDELCLPPSPPLLASAGFVPPAPFSYDYAYPAHPFSYPPAAVLEALPAAMRDEESWDSNEAEEEEEEDGEYEEEEVEDTQNEWTFKGVEGRWLDDNKAQLLDDAANDSDEEWLADNLDGNATEAEGRSSCAPSSYACSEAEEEGEGDEKSGEQEEAERLRQQLALFALSL